MSQPYAPAPAAYGSAYVPAPPRRSPWPACLAGMGCGCLGVVVALAAAGAAGYYAIQTGRLTLTDIALALGQGPAFVEVDNFRDDAIYVTFQQVDIPAGDDSAGYSGSLSLNSFDVGTYRAPAAGRYQVDFLTEAAGENLGICTLTLRSGDQYQFVTLPDGIVVNNVKRPSDVGADFNVESSSLCQ